MGWRGGGAEGRRGGGGGGCWGEARHVLALRGGGTGRGQRGICYNAFKYAHPSTSSLVPQSDGLGEVYMLQCV